MPRNMSKQDMISSEEIAEEYPLHMLVWYNNSETLNQKLAENKVSQIIRFAHNALYS